MVLTKKNIEILYKISQENYPTVISNMKIIELNDNNILVELSFNSTDDSIIKGLRQRFEWVLYEVDGESDRSVKVTIENEILEDRNIENESNKARLDYNEQLVDDDLGELEIDDLLIDDCDQLYEARLTDDKFDKIQKIIKEINMKKLLECKENSNEAIEILMKLKTIIES